MFTQKKAIVGIAVEMDKVTTLKGTIKVWTKVCIFY